MCEAPPQPILPPNGKAAWKVIHLLVLLESLERLSLHVLAPVAQPVSALYTEGWVGERGK